MKLVWWTGLACAASLAILVARPVEARGENRLKLDSPSACLDRPALEAAWQNAAAQPGALRKAALDQAAAKVAQLGCPTQGRTVIAVVDFALPSSLPRLWLADLKTGAGLAEPLYIAHGKGSDPFDSGLPFRFSNIKDSRMSSLGAFRGGEAYRGKHGRSLRIDGLEPHNNKARLRDIVLHTSRGDPLDYVSPQFLATHGKLGMSDGCFVVMRADYERVHRTLEHGGLLIAVGPDLG